MTTADFSPGSPIMIHSDYTFLYNSGKGKHLPRLGEASYIGHFTDIEN